MGKRLLIAVTLLGALSLAASASAGPIILFSTGNTPASGVFTLLPGGNASGSDIPIGLMTVVGSSVNGNFDTSGSAAPNAVPLGDANGSAALAFNTAENWVTITGGVPGLSIPDGTLLLSGTFTGFTADANGIYGATGESALVLGSLDLAPDTPFQFYGFSLTAQPVGADQWNVVSTAVRNTAVPAVPDPASSLLLFGTALGGLGWARRKWR